MKTKQAGRPRIRNPKTGLPDNEIRICANVDKSLWIAFKLACIKDGETVKARLSNLIERDLGARKR
jgi:hypothetical protein